MVWEKVDRYYKRRNPDLNVGRFGVYVPSGSKLGKAMEETNGKVIIFADDDEKKIAIYPTKDGDYKFVRRSSKGFEFRNSTYGCRVILMFLPQGRYVAKEEIVDGKKMFVFDRKTIMDEIQELNAYEKI